MKIIAQRQQEWASLKYLILSKSQPDYKAIRALFTDHEWNEKKEQAFRSYLQHALEQPAKIGDRLNAYQHVWGYFKNKVTDMERIKYQELIENFSLEQDEVLFFLKELAIKYQEEYLLQSSLLFPKEEE